MTYLLRDPLPEFRRTPLAVRSEADPVIVMAGEKVLLIGPRSAQPALPRWGDLTRELGPKAESRTVASLSGGGSMQLAFWPEQQALPADWGAERVRNLLFLLREPELQLALLGQQYGHFLRTHRFCGACGGATTPHEKELAQHCSACKRDLYPQIAPCMITLIHDGPRIVLTRARHFPKGMYGLSAGFVEAGESLEHCVLREVREETALEVKNVRYIASQPWPMPSQLMVGFFAEYAAGELTPDLEELEEAAWFDLGSLPGLPPPMSIAKFLIDTYIEEFQRGA